MCENTHKRVVILLCPYTKSVTILMTKYTSNTHKMYNPRITEPEMRKTYKYYRHSVVNYFIKNNIIFNTVSIIFLWFLHGTS